MEDGRCVRQRSPPPDKLLTLLGETAIGSLLRTAPGASKLSAVFYYALIVNVKTRTPDLQLRVPRRI